MNARQFALALFALVVPLSVFAQTGPSPLGWSGSARCQIDVQGRGYTDSQTHQWTMTGSPAVQGAFRVYQGTWSVTGGGSFSRSQGSQMLTAQWAANVSSMSAPIAVYVRASDGRMFVQARHTQLRGRSALQGYQQLVIDGKPQKPAQIAAEAFEWAFPVVELPRTGNTASGASSPVVKGSVGHMQPDGSHASASCTWQYGQGSAAPAQPAPLSATAIPAPPAPASPR